MVKKTTKKIIPYGRQSINKADIAAVVQILKSDWLTQGPTVKRFEHALCKKTGARYAVAVANGTAALHLAALAAGIVKGDEVITSPLTFLASANAVLYCGAQPIFADIQMATGCIDPREIEKKITKKTKAIIPVHFAGHPCELKVIKTLAKKHNLIIIEDAAHALGAEYRGTKVGSCVYSDMAIFSFHPVKTITTGEGGAVLTNNKRLYQRLLLLRNHGITKDADIMKNYDGPWYYEMHTLGFNYRITDMQCALGVNQLKKLNMFIRRRRIIASMYTKALRKIPGISMLREMQNSRSAWHLYVIHVPENRREDIFCKLHKRGVAVQVHYIPVYKQPYYRKRMNVRSNFPESERFYASAISLPIYPSLTNQEVRQIIVFLKEALL